MDPLREIVGTALRSDPALGSLATGGVHYRLVQDQELEPPFCIYHFEGGPDMWASSGGGMGTDVLVVKGAGPNPASVEDIDIRARAVLEETDFGFFCRRLGAIPDYDDVEKGEVNYYKGSRFRVAFDKEQL